tara:strand:- start:3063 stop:4019 length:957 start_codon:yes stop_codon:yes gene_type:complete
MEATVTLPSQLVERLMSSANELDLSISQYCQLLLENHLQEEDNTVAADHSILDPLKLINLGESRLNSTTIGHPLGGGAVSGHINRMLPLKYGCRMLWSLLDEQGSGPTIHDFRSAIRASVAPLRALLKQFDEHQGRERGSRTHSSFPNGERAATNRFLNHYMIRRARAGETEPSGALYDFGLISVDDSGRVQFTDPGKRFVREPNPIIDNSLEGGPSLSPTERALIVSQVRNNMGEEWAYMRHIIDGIHIGSNTPSSLLSRIHRRYGPGTKANWSESVIPHMRSGVLGRMQALGFIERIFTANRVEYTITPAAIHILD